MRGSFLRTSDIAKASGVHPNTVRMYEEYGYLSPIPRTPKGYRIFTEDHLDQVRLVRTIMKWPYSGGKSLVITIIKHTAREQLGSALEDAYRYLTRVKAEIDRAEMAAELLEHWASGMAIENTSISLSMRETAELLDITTDALRNWERNGLIKIPRNPKNNYRVYGSDEIARLCVIRTLRKARYSMMAILRMMLVFDKGQKNDLKKVLDTPAPDEDVYSVFDKWQSALKETEKRVRKSIQL
ncbi:MAG: MerR family transcriptional regulator, partial [Desulfobacteraceae bacterium]